MTTPSFFAAGDAPRLLARRAVVFSDRATGRVRHVHTVLLCEGANELSETALLDEARHIARRLGREVEALDARVVSHPADGPPEGA